MHLPKDVTRPCQIRDDIIRKRKYVFQNHEQCVFFYWCQLKQSWQRCLVQTHERNLPGYNCNLEGCHTWWCTQLFSSICSGRMSRSSSLMKAIWRVIINKSWTGRPTDRMHTDQTWSRSDIPMMFSVSQIDEITTIFYVKSSGKIIQCLHFGLPAVTTLELFSRTMPMHENILSPVDVMFALISIVRYKNQRIWFERKTKASAMSMNTMTKYKIFALNWTNYTSFIDGCNKLW